MNSNDMVISPNALDGGEHRVGDFAGNVKLIEMLRNVRDGKNISIHYQHPARSAAAVEGIPPSFSGLDGSLSLTDLAAVPLRHYTLQCNATSHIMQGLVCGR